MKKNLELSTAREAIEATAELAQCTAFTGWFIPELQRRSDLLADEILHNEMEPEAREKLRQRRLQLLEVLQLPMDARMSAVGLLGEGD